MSVHNPPPSVPPSGSLGPSPDKGFVPPAGTSKLPAGQSVSKEDEELSTAIRQLKQAASLTANTAPAKMEPKTPPPPEAEDVAAVALPVINPSSEHPLLSAHQKSDVDNAAKLAEHLSIISTGNRVLEQGENLIDDVEAILDTTPDELSYATIKQRKDQLDEIVKQLTLLDQEWQNEKGHKESPNFAELNENIKLFRENIVEVKRWITNDVKFLTEGFGKHVKTEIARMHDQIDKFYDWLPGQTEYNPIERCVRTIQSYAEQIRQLEAGWDAIKTIAKSPVIAQRDLEIQDIRTHYESVDAINKFVDDYETYLKETFAFFRVAKDYKFLGKTEFALLGKIPDKLWVRYECADSESSIRQLAHEFLEALRAGRDLSNPNDKFHYERDRVNLSYILAQLAVAAKEKLKPTQEIDGNAVGPGMEQLD